MTTTLIASYLGFGTLAARPATPAIDTGAIAFYYATDVGVLYAYASGAWTTAGLNPGSPPTVVQSAANNNGSNSVTMGVAPTNGNLLIAMTFNPTVVSPGTGWTLLANNSTGTDIGAIFTKPAGAGESTTQTPLSSAPSTGCMVVWEIHGANASPIIGSALEAEQTGATYQFTPPVGPLDKNLLFLGAIGMISSSGNFTKTMGAVQDQFLNTGALRQIAAGHASLANFPIAQLAVLASASLNFKALGLIITS